MAATSPASPSPTGASAQNTMSTHKTELVKGTHQFTIVGYSLQKRSGVGKVIRSGGFEVGGHGWKIQCHPAGFAKEDEGYLSLFLELSCTAIEKVTAKFSFQIIGPAGKNSPPSIPLNGLNGFTPANTSWGFRKFMKIETVESKYLRDDCLTISCTVEVEKEPRTVATRSRQIITVPPSRIAQDLAGLRESKEGSDVTFQIGQNAYDAHKLVIAMRSPVFRAQFFGPLANNATAGRGGDTRVVPIHDMKPAAFEAMLHFIYTDSLPPVAEDDDCFVREGSAKRAKLVQKSAGCSTKESHREMICDWLAAADRYDLERMRLMCESLLSETINVENAAATLQLADRHHCPQLKAFCVDYITSPGVLRAVLATDGYKELKVNCPSLLADVLEAGET